MYCFQAQFNFSTNGPVFALKRNAQREKQSTPKQKQHVAKSDRFFFFSKCPNYETRDCNVSCPTTIP